MRNVQAKREHFWFWGKIGISNLSAIWVWNSDLVMTCWRPGLGRAKRYWLHERPRKLDKMALKRRWMSIGLLRRNGCWCWNIINLLLLLVVKHWSDHPVYDNSSSSERILSVSLLRNWSRNFLLRFLLFTTGNLKLPQLYELRWVPRTTPTGFYGCYVCTVRTWTSSSTDEFGI